MRYHPILSIALSRKYLPSPLEQREISPVGRNRHFLRLLRPKDTIFEPISGCDNHPYENLR
jgi:hypothetical protein